MLIVSTAATRLVADENANEADAAAGAPGNGAAADAPSNEAPSPFATKFDDPPPQPAATVDAATFNGVQPGETTGKQLAEKWGEGKLVSHDNGELVLSFALEGYPHVEATIVDDKVRTLVVNLPEALPPVSVARKLQLENIRPVNVPDDAGQLLGQAFPERGVLFSTSSDGKKVSQVVLE